MRNRGDLYKPRPKPLRTRQWLESTKRRGKETLRSVPDDKETLKSVPYNNKMTDEASEELRKRSHFGTSFTDVSANLSLVRKALRQPRHAGVVQAEHLCKESEGV